MGYYIRLFLLLFIVQHSLNAQQVRPDDGYLFDQTIVPKIEVYLSQDSLDIMLLPTNVRSNHEYRAICIITKGDTKDTINDIGLRLRGNSSRLAYKKSFKISFLLTPYTGASIILTFKVLFILFIASAETT